MLSRRTKFFALVALLTAALVPGAAVFVRPAYACSLVAVESPSQLVPQSELIVVGTVLRVDNGVLLMRPEAFLKGPVSALPIRLPLPENGIHATLEAQGAECPRIRANVGDRLLVFVSDSDAPHYPYANEAYLLVDGRARMDGVPELTETEAVAEVRAVTGQYAVPASSGDEGAGIDWGHTVIPLGAALAVIFVIGLVLMRVWHRIDPS